jgi:GntR family transcriptional regulator
VTIDPDGAVAPYLQLVTLLRARIESGAIPPGHRLPSQTQLESETGLSRSTIKRAVEILKNEGLITTSPGRGLFVVERDEENAK